MLALKGRGRTSPNPVVGAVIVRGRRVIAEGWHRRCGGEHAEIIALKKAGLRARGATLYVTLEPCFHYGRTPPCVDRIIHGGIRRVVVGAKDPNPRTHGKSIAKLRRQGIRLTVGLLQDEITAMNEAFNKYITKRIPFVAAKCAQTLDGKIATAVGHSKWITSPQSREYARRIRDEFDAICVGANTVLKDDPRLNGKGKTKKLKKIILDSRLRISPKARLFSGTRPQDCILAVTKKAPVAKIKRFEQKGVTVIRCPQRGGRVDMRWLFKALAKREIVSILLEGGARVIGQALSDKLIDKFYIYVAPKILGDQNALSSVVGINAVQINKAVSLKKLTLRKIGKDVLITGYV